MNFGFHPQYQPQNPFSPVGKMQESGLENFSSFLHDKYKPQTPNSFKIIRAELDQLEQQISNGGPQNELIESQKKEISRLKDMVNNYKALQDGVILLTSESEKLQKKIVDTESVLKNSKSENTFLKRQTNSLEEKAKHYEKVISEQKSEITELCSQLNNSKVNGRSSHNHSSTNSSQNNDIQHLLEAEKRKSEELLKIIAEHEKEREINQKQFQEFEAVQAERTALQSKIENFEKMLSCTTPKKSHEWEGEEPTYDELVDRNKNLENKVKRLRIELSEKDDEINMYSEKQDELIIEFENKFTDLMMENERLYSLTVDRQQTIDRMNSQGDFIDEEV